MTEYLGEDEWPSASQVARRLDRTIESLRQQLAECQARRNQILDVLYLHKNAGNPAYELMVEQVLKDRPDSTALDTMLKQAKREALLEAAERLKKSPIKWTVLGPEAVVKEMAKELE